VKDSLIYNNTIYVGPEQAVDLLLFSDWHGWSDTTFFYNNIFYVAGHAQFSYGVSRADDGAYSTKPGFGESKKNEFDSNTFFGISALREDRHALTTDPKFVQPARGGIRRFSLEGYRLQTNSPARKSGRKIERNGGRDFWGNVAPSCNFTDRGASQLNDCQGGR